MVAVVIMSILVVAGIPSFATFIQNRKVRTAADAIHNGLSLAKAEAVRRNTVITFNLAAGSSWNVTCGNCNDVNSTTAIQQMAAAEVSPTVATSPTTLALNFNGFGKVTSLADGTNSTIDISNTVGTCETAGGSIRCLRIVVTPGGQVRTCDPRLTVTNPTNPQAC